MIQVLLKQRLFLLQFMLLISGTASMYDMTIPFLAFCTVLIIMVAKICDMSIMPCSCCRGAAWLGLLLVKQVNLLLQVVLVSALWLWQHCALLLRHLLCCPLRCA